MFQQTTPLLPMGTTTRTDAHVEVLRQVVDSFDERLAEYDAHIQDMHRKLLPVVQGLRGGIARDRWGWWTEAGFEDHAASR
jgi:hypothetical protein